MQALFDTIRAQASRAAWSQGVELARSGAVQGERESAHEVVLRVRPLAGVVHPTVLLFPEDEAWECDCGGEDDPCAHVAAAVIALRAAKKDGQPLPAAEARSSGRVAYRFRTTPAGLALERVVVHAGGEAPLTSTLSALASRRAAGPPVSPSRTDLTVESVLGTHREGALPRGILRALLPLLEGHPSVWLDGQPVATSREALGACARLSDDGPGFRLRVAVEPTPERDLGGGFVLCEGAIRELAPLSLGGREREELLGAGRRFSADEAATLVADVLPSLASRMPVHVESERLPRGHREPPRLAVETARAGDGLSVLATLVYGDPPCARVDAGRLVHLRGPIPLRDEEAESRLVTRLRATLGLAPGHRVELAPEAAIPFVERLERLGVSVSGDAHRGFRLEAKLEPELRIAGDGFTLRFRTRADEGEREAEPGAVLAAFRRGESLVPLLGGGFAPLPTDWLARFAGPLADLLAARQPSGRVPAALLPDLARPLRAARSAAAARLRAPRRARPRRLARDAAARGSARRAAPVPEGRRALARVPPRAPASARCSPTTWGSARRCRRSPRSAAARSSWRRRACSTTGRTRSRASVPALRDERLSRRRPQPRCRRGRHAHHLRDPAPRSRHARRRGVGHARARRGAGDQEPESQVAQAAFALCAERRIALTGTPVENRLDELWSQLHFLNPGLLGGRSDFDERYARPIAAGDAGRRRAPARSASARSCCAASRARWRPSCRRAPSCVLHVRARRARSARLYDAVAAATRAEVVATARDGRRRDGRARGAAPPAPGLLPPAPRPGPDADQSAKLELLVDRARARSRPRATRRSSSRSGRRCSISSEPHLAAAGHPLHAPRRLHARSRRRGRELPGRGRPARLADLAARPAAPAST